MTIKKQNFKEATKSVSFIKGISKKAAAKWLLDHNMMEFDDMFIIIGADRQIDVKLWIIFTPDTMEINL